MLDPPSGSLRPKQEMSSPFRPGAKYFAFCSAVPLRQIGHRPMCACTDQVEANAWLTRLISSRARHSPSLSKPEPPSFSG